MPRLQPARPGSPKYRRREDARVAAALLSTRGGVSKRLDARGPHARPERLRVAVIDGRADRGPMSGKRRSSQIDSSFATNPHGERRVPCGDRAQILAHAFQKQKTVV